MPRSRSAASPPGVVGPLAASTTNLHCSRFALSSARTSTVRQQNDYIGMQSCSLCKERCSVSPVMTPPMAAGTSTSQGISRISSLLIAVPA